MSKRVSISSRAETDLAHQYRWYLENAGAEVAERFLIAFERRVVRLTQNPLLGRLRRFRSAELVNIRSISLREGFSVHLIFYQASEDRLSIERVIHGARDLPRRLLEPPES